MNIHSIYNKISPIFRRRRMQAFIGLIQPKPSDRILDVGGYPSFWELLGPDFQVTILNTHEIEQPYKADKYTYVVGDGTCLPYADQEFDIVFSNSVIEHLGTREMQVKFAREVVRVGKRFWVQTPA